MFSEEKSIFVCHGVRGLLLFCSSASYKTNKEKALMKKMDDEKGNATALLYNLIIWEEIVLSQQNSFKSWQL